MKQSHTMSIIESITNISVGYLVSVVAAIIILPMFGFAITWGDSFIISIFFTVVSIVRSYMLRRIFEHIRWVRTQRP